MPKQISKGIKFSQYGSRTAICHNRRIIGKVRGAILGIKSRTSAETTKNVYVSVIIKCSPHNTIRFVAAKFLAPCPIVGPLPLALGGGGEEGKKGGK